MIEYSKTIKFFIKEDDFEFCFVNFKNPESFYQYKNDLMLAKIKITGKTAIVFWINGMSSKIDVSELNIVPLFAASGSDTSRTTPNPEKGSLKLTVDDKNILIKLINNPNNDLLLDYRDKLTNKLQANGETPTMDNPVPSLEITKKYLPRSNGNSFTFLKDDLVKFCNEIIQYGRTTDKEDLEIEMVKVKGNNIVGDFCIGKYQVTQKQWKKVMGSNPSYFKSNNLPVESVSWNDVQEFLKKLNDRYPGKNYRLPREAEWEYAARGGNQSKGYEYSGSNNIKDVAWFDGNSVNKTHPVGALKPNELGLYDMSGNVWEWCCDRYLNDSTRVLRGGSWDYSPQYTRVAYRSYGTPAYRYNDVGFRLASSFRDSDSGFHLAI